MAIEIKDFTIYNSEMEKGIKDKLFFLKFLDPKNTIYRFLDYGCANGKVLEAISNIDEFKYGLFCGYDESSDMIKLALSQWESKYSENAYFSTKLRDLPKDKRPTVLILSSVLHEVYSRYSEVYGTKAWINGFWEDIFNLNTDYIAIRDMCYSEDMYRPVPKTLPTINFNDYYKNFKEKTLVRDYQVEDFERKWGNCNNIVTLLHFFLKYRYIANWKREVEENYFSVSDEDLLNRISKSNYNIVYYERFQLPTIYSLTHFRTGYGIDDCTHVKIFLKKKGI